MAGLDNFERKALVFALTSVVCIACARDEIVPKQMVSNVDGKITFTASMGDADTKSGAGPHIAKKTIGTFDLGGNKLLMTCEEGSLGGAIGSAAASTKGTPVNSANFNDIYGSFSVDCAISEDGETISDALPAIDEEGNLIEWDYGDYTDYVYFYDVPFTKNDGIWSIPTDDFPEFASFYWPKLDYEAGDDPSNYMPLSFFAYAPASIVEPKQGYGWYGSYTYGGPDGESWASQSFDGKVEFYHLLDYWDDRNYTESDWIYSRNSERYEVCLNDAETQPDLLLASTGIVNCPQDGNPIPLKFYHILSGIRFKVADDFPVGTTLNYVRFDNVWWDGYCTFDPNASGSTSADKVSWTFPDGCATASFRQNFNVEVAASRDFDNDKIQGGDMLYKDDVIKTFMMIPQSFGSSGNSPEATICIGVNINGEDSEIELPLPQGTQWQAGKLYTYSLGLTFNDNEDGVEIEVTEEFEEPSWVAEIYYKENVKVENTVVDPYYLRIAILAYEIDSNDNVWDWWKDEEQWLYTAIDAGILEGRKSIPDYFWGTWSLNTDGGWVKVGDYYYYRYPLAGGTSTEAAFDQLRVPCLTTDRSEVDIITQGVPWVADGDHKAAVRTSWGEDVAAQLYDSPRE